MKILFLSLLSFVYLFGDAVYPAGTGFIKNTNTSCTPTAGTCPTGTTCMLDYDENQHCIKQDTSGTEKMYYATTDQHGNPARAEVKRYNDNNSENYKLDKRDDGSFKRVIGDMDVIGATVVIPKEDEYSFDPSKAGKLPSPVVDRKFVNEISGLGTTKFNNSSSAKFEFKEKSQYEREHIDGSKIKYARLYWGGSLYKEWNLKTDYTATIFEDMYGYSRVNFKTPKDTYVVQAEKKDIKLTGSFSQGDPTIMTDDSWNASDVINTSGRGGYYYVYQASADVTEQVKASLGTDNGNRVFAVGGIVASIEKMKKIDRESGVFITFPTNQNPHDTPPFGMVTKKFGVPYGAILYADGKWNSAFGPAQFGGWSLVIVYDMGEEGEKNGIEPRAINIYDGMADIYPDTTNQDKPQKEFDLKFDGFYTPPSGNKQSTLAFFGFGARSEILGEDIQVKNKNNNNFETIFSSQNPSNNQFNSSIARFDKPADNNKIYNGQMDLDLMDISNKMGPRQTEVDVRFKAAGMMGASGFNGDRQNIGMVAFSTLLYNPKVCYTEKLEVSRDNGASWIAVNTKGSAGGATTVKKGSLLRSTVTVQNRGSEDALKTLLRVELDPKFISYKNVSKIITSTANPKDEYWTSLSNSGQNLRVISSHNLEYTIGEGATFATGGKLKHDHSNYARVQFVGELNSEYKKIGYKSKFENSDAGLQYEDRISECTPTNYDLKIVDEEENDFYPRSKGNDTSENFKNRLFTKIANKSFNITISNYSKLDGKLKAPDSNTKVTMKLVTSCSLNNSVIPDVVYDFTTSTHTLTKQVKVPKPYRDLHVKLTYHNNVTNQTDEKCDGFDSFAVRPAMFQLYDKSGVGGLYTGSTILTGGKSYKDIALAAYNEDGATLANGYIHTLSADSSTKDTVSLLAVDKTGCVVKSSLKDGSDNKLKIVFDNPNKAVGTISKIGSSSEGFTYSDIGEAKFYVRDKSYTEVDQKATNEASDCVLDSSSNSENSDGKFGCDIEFGEKKFNFDPKDLEVSEFKILSSGISYVANESEAPAPTLNFKVRARLFNDNPALLYKDGCYSNNTTFKIKVGEIIANYIDNNGSKLSSGEDGVKKLNSEIMFFGDRDTNALVKKVNLSPHDGTYEVKKELFRSDGTAEINIKFNFKREKNVVKNPFEVTSDTFTFESLVDDKANKDSGYKKPTTKTSAKFYYARTYAPYYEGPNTGFKAKIYYGVYCNGCDESKFMLQKPGSTARWEEFAGAHSWYVNPLHDSAYGKVKDYTYTNESSRTVEDKSKRTSPADGISYIFVSNPKAVTDVAKMDAENWLIYNEFDKDAATNDFTLRFLVPNGDWAGKTLKSGSNKGNVGNVVGGENNFNDLSDKTNRRISW
nr:hypothetical protein [uncultured Campylobacter sp.]